MFLLLDRRSPLVQPLGNLVSAILENPDEGTGEMAVGLWREG